MPRMSQLTVDGRIKAYDSLITHLQNELDDDLEIYEFMCEKRYLMDRFIKERQSFADNHGVEL